MKFCYQLAYNMASIASTTNFHDNSDLSDGEYDYKTEFKNDKPDTRASHIGLVLNGSYGGFVLSDWAKEKLGITSEYCYGINRFNPALVELVKRHGKKASGSCSHLHVKYIPIGYYQGKDSGDSYNKRYYRINEYDGAESIELNSEQYDSDQRDKDIQALVQVFGGILLDDGLTPDQKVNNLKLFFPEGEIDVDRCIESVQESDDYSDQFQEAKRSL